MTPEKIKLVQDSFAQVAPIADKAADIFYDRLFEIAPDVRPMFPADMSNQKDKLMQTLGVAVSNLHQVETILPTVQDLGRKHVAYGVKDEHYDTVGSALLFTLEKGLGEAFTPQVKDAWTETFTTVAGVMKEAAATVEEPKKGFFSKLFGKRVA
ncbi:globin family protein [Roseibium sp.]|uniref:globin family protein n=1 Tax=Roseibium sp. TaxID=1936156 RepID=UPI003BAED5CC